ncbi:MAG: hypothetical protein K0U47_05620 [Epsilonproteobacteria bacterium]|nr:hypothetical protein [Campylobacterota bacterium]
MIKKHKKRGSPFSLTYVFASFFGAAMVASAFAYHNYEFSKYKFFDFKDTVFYQKSDLFTPKAEKYTVLVYSSNMQESVDIAQKIKDDNVILAIDLYQKRFKEEDSIIHITSGMNTLLKFVQKFNIYDVPCVFEIVKYKDLRYKQNTRLEVIE